MNSMYGFQSIALKEFLHLRRDVTTLVIALAIPVIQLILFGYAIDFDIRHIRTMIVDTDRSPASRQFIDNLRTTDYLQIVSEAHNPMEAEDALRRGDVRVAVIIPPDFGRISGSPFGNRPQVKVMIDGSDSQVALRARMAFVRPATSGAEAGVDVRFNIMYNPDMRTATFMIPGLIGVILQLVTVALTSFSLVREREQGSLEQLMVSPVGRLGLMIGKLVPYACLALIEVVMVLTLGRLVFDVHVAGSVALLFLLSIPFVVATLSLGLLISTVAKTQAAALQFTILITLPSILMSGFIFPRDTMPGCLYLLTFLLPVTYYIEILRGIVVRGAGFFDVWPSLAALLVIDCVLIAVATARFRKTLV
ncbi:MAG: ABC transporter permease [Capsulimonadaceae bacterium]|nr:ABC transporter permease [Capsulimonadaceae bacterium]